MSSVMINCRIDKKRGQKNQTNLEENWGLTEGLGFKFRRKFDITMLSEYSIQ